MVVDVQTIAQYIGISTTIAKRHINIREKRTGR
jgi:hypothetical protein